MRFNHILNNCVKTICTIAALAMVYCSIAVYKADAVNLFAFLLFIVFYVQFPGFLISRLTRVSSGHISSDLLLSFFFGWAFVVFEYFVAAYTGAVILLYAAGPCISILWLITCYKEHRHINWQKFKISAIPVSLFFTVLLLLAYAMLNTQFVYMAPEYSKCIYASIDKCYQMGLISSLADGYPLVNPWVYDRIVSYHIFSQLLLSVPVRIFGLTPDFVVMSCSPYLTAYLLSLSFYSLFRYFCNRKERAGVYSLSILLSNMFIARSITSSYLFRIIFINDNHGGFAIAAAIAWLLMLDIYLRSIKDPHSRSTYKALLVIILMMLLTGIKAPVGLVMTGGLIGTVLLGLIIRKVKPHSLIIMLAVSAGFYVVYYFLLSGDAEAGLDDSSIFSFGSMTGICFWKEGLISTLKAAGIPPVIRLLAILLCFAAFFFTIYLLPFTIGYLRELILVLRGIKDYSISRVTVYAASVVGFILMMFLRYEGHSQVYFGTVLVAFAPLIAFWFFEDINAASSTWIKSIAVICRTVFFSLLIFTTATLAGSYQSMLPDAIKHADPESQYNKYRSMSAQEYEAMKWISSNTEEGSLLATQMYASVSDKDYSYFDRWHNCHFLYAAYSGRCYYLEGSGFTFSENENEVRKEMININNRMFDPHDSERADVARSLGVDYIVVTQSLHPTDDLSSDDYIKVFSNEDIDIYKITES